MAADKTSGQERTEALAVHVLAIGTVGAGAAGSVKGEDDFWDVRGLGVGEMKCVEGRKLWQRLESPCKQHRTGPV